MDALDRALRAFRHALFVGGLAAAVPLAAGAAPVANGDFETGSTAGWRVYWDSASPGAPLAYVAAIGASAQFPPLGGNYSALISSVSYFPTGQFGTSCANDLFNPNHCPPYPPTNVPSAPNGGPAVTHPLPALGLPPTDYGRGYIAQDFTGSAGQRIEWDWQLHALADKADFMFAALTDGEHFFVYATREQAALYAEWIDPPIGPIQWLDMSFGLPSLPYGSVSTYGITLPNDGLWSLYLGVSQMADAWWSAPIQIDNVRLTGKVAEPATFALALLGSVLLWWRARRRAPA